MATIFGRIGLPHPSSALELYQNCIYADYNATTPIYEGNTKFPIYMERILPF